MTTLNFLRHTIFLCCVPFLLISFHTAAQVGIGTTNPDVNAKLDITSTAAEPGGLLLPRVALVAINDASPLTAPVSPGMAVYNTATSGTPPNQVTPGYYYHDGTQWVRLAAAFTPSDDWTLTGNAGLNANNNFLGTTDNVPLRFRTNNADRFEISSGNAANRGRLRAFEDGSAARPVYSFSNSIASGMYSSGTNILAFSTNSNERMRLLANGQVVVNNTGAPSIGDRLTVQGASNEYAINGYATGASGVGVYGASTGSGNGVRGTNNNTGMGVIGFSSLTGTGTQGQNSGTGYGMAAFNTGTGGALFLQSNLVNIFSDLTDAGGVGEYIDFDNRNGVGVNVVGVIDPTNPSGGTAGDVWAFSGAIKTQTPTTTTQKGSHHGQG